MICTVSFRAGPGTGGTPLYRTRVAEDQFPSVHEVDDVAKLVKDLDKFDMIVQAWEYEKRDKKGAYLQQFFDSTMTVFGTPLVKLWQQHLLQHREKHFAEA